MKNKFSKFINLQGKYLTSLLFVLLFAVGQMWGAGTALSSLNFNAPTSLPSAYTYSSTNTPAIEAQEKLSSISSINVCVSGSSTLPSTWSATNAAAPSGGKRWIAFQPAVDCRVTLKIGGINNSRIFYLLDKDHTTTSSNVSSYTMTKKETWYDDWSVSLTGGTWYAITGSGSNCYITSMQFVANPTFSESAGAELTQNEGTVTLTASGTTIYYKWSTSATAYAANAGATLAAEADGSGTSPKTATAPDGTGTYYLYAVAKSGNYYSDVVKRNYSIVAGGTPIQQYTVTLMPAGGSAASYDGWTYDDVNKKYTKEVSSGTELALPTFTKENRTFKTWRKAGPTDVTSPITVTADVTLTAVWNATVENVLYSWEGAEGGATETGGTATGSVDGLINVAKSGYYCLQINGNTSYDKYVQITLSGEEKVKTGDKIRYTGFYTNTGTKNAAVKMRASGGTAIFTGANLPRIEEASPRTDTYVVPEGINTASVQITRHQTQTNSYLTKLQIIRPEQVEEANIRTVTFNYNDGGTTANKVVEVASGSKVSAEAAPSYAHHRFHEWQLGGVAYDFSTAVTSNITLTADWTQLYTVIYAKGATDATGDAPTQDELAANEKFTVAANTFEYEGHDFSKWNDGTNDYAPGVKYTMGTANVTLTAQWITATTKVTVTYKDGETTLGSEEITINTGNPVGYATYQTRNLATFDGWYNDPDLAEGHKIADISALTASANVNVYGKWNYQYATSVNIEQWTLDNGKGVSDAQKETQTGALVSLLGTRKFASNIAYDKGNIELDSLNDDPSKTNRNYAYLGLKVKKSGKMLDFRLAKDSYVKVKFGNVAATPKVSINGADYADMELTAGVYSYTATGNDYVSIKTASDGAVVFQQVMINEDIAAVTLPWLVTYDANGGICATAKAVWSGADLTLPDVAPADADHTFAGWYDGDDLAGVAGANYTATKNVTLQAHYAPVEYAVNYYGGEGATGTMTAGAAGWGTLVTPATNAFEKTGHIFSGWEITKTEDGSATGITFSEGKFEMPKYDVTLVAQWEDVSKVAVIVETNVKYETLAAAIAAATDGQTIQLLQNNNVTAQVEVAGKAITLDLAGYKIEYTGTSTLPSGVILVHNGASLTIDDSSDPDAGSIVSGADAYAAIALTKAGDDAANPAVLEINGGTFTGDYYAITGNGSRHNTQITINGGTISGAHANDNSAIYHPQQGTLTVNNGTLTGYSAAIEMRAGTLVINNGTFTATATEYSCNPNGSGTTTVGAAIAIAQHNTQKDIAVTINGGTFEGVKAINEANPQGNPDPAVAMSVTDGDFTGEVSTVDVNHFISGGTFDAPVAHENCAEKFVPKDNGNNTYGVTPKDGVCIVWADATGNNAMTVDANKSLFVATAAANNTKNTSEYGGKTGYKLNSRPAHMSVTLSEETFQAGDVVEVFVTSVADDQGANDKMRVFTANDVTKRLVEGDADMVQGANRLTLPETTTNALYLVRGAENADYDMWNPFVAYIAVYRPMMPELTAISFNGVAATKGTGNAFAVTLPNGANLASLTVVPTVIRNEAHATTPEAVITNEGAWVFGENTYRVMDKDGDYTDYTITLVEAAGIKEVQISGTLNVMEEGTTTLSALVIDTNDEEAAIQDVTWASDAEGVATVVNGVVTGVAVGTAHITATSVADGSKSKTVEVTVTPFSGCKRAFWFAYADDAAANNVTNNSTVFVSCPTGSNNTGEYPLTIGTDVYTATKNGGSFAEAARLVIPSGFSATFYAKVRGSGSNKKITLISTADESVKYSSGTFSSNDAQVSIEDIPAGTYKLTSDGLSRLYVMAVEMCKYPMVGVSLTATESVLVGETVTLTPVFDPTNASNKNVTWESDDEDVATVANGVVTGVAAGTANITVTTEDGNFHATCTVTVSELDCDTYLGNLFALTIKDVEATSVSVSTTEIDMSTYATIENGTAFVARTDGSASHKIAYNQSSSIQMQFNTDKLYLKLNLQRCALKEGDMIAITGTDDNEFSFTTDATRATTYKTTGHKYVVQYGDALVGASTIYVWRVSGNTYMKSISIDRVAPSYTRPVNPAYLGTLCWTNNAAIVGATLYELAGKNENNYLVFDEVISKRLEAGKPYIFMPENGNTLIKLYNTDTEAALTEDQDPVNHMYGTVEGKSLSPLTDTDMYYFSSNHIWRVADFTDDVNIPAYYCYVDYNAVLNDQPAPAPAQGRRRITMGVNGTNTATGMDEVNSEELRVKKMLINGQIFILRGEKMYDATGRLVK